MMITVGASGRPHCERWARVYKSAIAIASSQMGRASAKQSARCALQMIHRSWRWPAPRRPIEAEWRAGTCAVNHSVDFELPARPDLSRTRGACTKSIGQSTATVPRHQGCDRRKRLEQQRNPRPGAGRLVGNRATMCARILRMKDAFQSSRLAAGFFRISERIAARSIPFGH